MSFDREQANKLFDTAVELPELERASYLEKECAGDRELRAEVESLLASDAEASRFLNEPLLSLPSALYADVTSDVVGRKFGAYRIVREIGRGGLGTVYLAERADETYRKEVALKLVRRGLDTEDILRRFQHERQILAHLEHPNIARLLDGGTTEDGLPYFVMEYVQGEPLLSFCNREALDLEARLELFRKICFAVTYAHQNLVIHRDLKPSNILVTPEGEPKLLDFGIAKLIQAEEEDEFTVTVPALRLLTPDYASPEQIEGGKATTASDVYSLGVLLYELLSGTKPYRLKSGTSEELARVVAEQKPLRLKAIPLELQNIARMAMRQEPERRYASVAEFAEDARRYLAGLPVLAQKDTFGYRTKKFVERNKVAAVATALVLCSLVLGMVVALSQARRATAQARLAREQRDAAEQARRRAEETSHFIQSFLTYANPMWYGRGQGRNNVTVREAIDDAAGRLETELANEPEVRADLHHTIGPRAQAIPRIPGALSPGRWRRASQGSHGPLLSERDENAAWQTGVRNRPALPRGHRHDAAD